MEAHEEITIRMLDEGDREELRRLAQLDSASVPAAPLLGVSSGGRLIAARSLATGDSIADPWARTAAPAALLEQRASHLSGRRRWWQRGSRAALPGSPPGAGGRLLDLHARSA